MLRLNSFSLANQSLCISANTYCGQCCVDETLSRCMYCPSELVSFVPSRLCSHVRCLSRLYSATQPAKCQRIDSASTDLLAYSGEKTKKNNQQTKKTGDRVSAQSWLTLSSSSACAVIDSTLEASRCCQHHMPAYFLQPTYFLTAVLPIWIPSYVIKERNRLEIIIQR